MRYISLPLFFGATLALAPLSHGADFLELLGLGKSKSTNPPAVSETNLFTRFHPIVQKATEQTGVTRTYKSMMGKRFVPRSGGHRSRRLRDPQGS